MKNVKYLYFIFILGQEKTRTVSVVGLFSYREGALMKIHKLYELYIQFKINYTQLTLRQVNLVSYSTFVNRVD